MTSQSQVVIQLDVPLIQGETQVTELVFPVPLRLRHLIGVFGSRDTGQALFRIIQSTTGLDRELILDLSAADISKINDHLHPALRALHGRREAHDA